MNLNVSSFVSLLLSSSRIDSGDPSPFSADRDDLELGTQELLDALEHQYTSLHAANSEQGYPMEGRR